jgi:hypothetical protein
MSNESETATRGADWSIIALLAAMVIIMAVVAFTLHRNSPWLLLLPAARPSPARTGMGASGARAWGR